MNRSVLLHEIEGLALSEKILLVEDIWDSIARGNCIFRWKPASDSGLKPATIPVGSWPRIPV